MSSELMDSIISQLPEDWIIDKIKHQVENKPYSIVDGPFGTQLHNDEYVNEGIPVIRIVNLNYDGQFDPEKLVFITEEKYQTLKRSSVKSGDLIIAKTGATIGKVGVFEGYEKGVIASSCLKISLNEQISPDFFKYYLISDYCQKQIILTSSGSTRDTINMEQIANLQLTLPQDINTQIQIANYLDKQTAKINATIAKNKKLIDLLEEKRVVLINQVVTKGLNPNVPKKDSGIEWIGEIPKNWEVTNLKKYFYIHNGSTPKDLEENWDGDICWITPADYKTTDVYINQSSRQITKVGLNSCGTTLVPKGSIIVSNRAPIGTVAIANTDLCTNQGCKSLSIKKDINTKFVYYILSINDKELNKLGRGTTFMELSSYDLGTFPIPIPSILEQENIVEYLDNEILKINKTITKIRENITLLEEYKTSLIHHVVTGKIDVREEVI